MAKKTQSNRSTSKKVTKKTTKVSPKKVAKVSQPAASKKKAPAKVTKKVAKKAATSKPASKKAATKPVKKPTTKKVAAKTKPAVKKAAPTKAPAKKPATPKKPAATKKAPSKKPVTKKAATKKVVSKKAPAKKPVVKTKKVVAKTPVSKKAGDKKTSSKPAAASKQATDPKNAKGQAAAGDDPKGARKGITIVTKKRSRRAPAPILVMPKFAPLGAMLKNHTPLIPSGPKAGPSQGDGDDADVSGKKIKSPFNKKQLEKFRQILLKKRRELVGDVSIMENEALKGGSGDLSNLPQHMAEQGSDAYDQSLSMDLAAADRRLIKEIDDALERINEGTFGLCERTKKPIRIERLEELPWARYSIETARELERQTYRP